MKIEGNNMNNENKYCEEIELLVDEYLDGMITSEDKQKMETHLTGCAGCRKYIEETVFLMEKAVLLSKSDDIISKGKKQELWNKIEAKINAPVNASDTHIYNMSGLEDKSAGTVEHIPTKPGMWNSMRYYISGIAAVVVLAFVIYGVNQFMKRSGSNITDLSSNVVEIGGPKWMVTPIKGSPMINDMVMKAIDSLAIGGFITTNDSSKAELYVAGLGTVTIEPGSKVRLIKSAPGEHRIALDYGSIDASILAKPRTFFVDAGNVTAVDLGCSYKFSIDKAGDGLLYVRSGMVALESASGRQSIVPEGKFCVTKQDMGPGTPFREDSSPQLKKALMEFDFGNCGGECVNVILKNSKKTDAVTLVNILPRVEEQYKYVVYQKAATYCAPPKNMRRDSIPNLQNVEHLNEWVDKIMEEVHENIQQNISRVEKQIEEQMKQFDEEKWQKQWKENWEKNWDKNVKKWNYNYDNDTVIMHNGETWITPNTPSLDEMEELKQELEKLHEELNVDNEEFRNEMVKVKEELKKVNEEIRKEIEESRKETEKEMKNQRKQQENENKHKAREKNENEDGDKD
jgi:BMFP domain-containing protein YqiC